MSTEYSACVIVGLPFDEVFTSDDYDNDELDHPDLHCCTFSAFSKPIYGIIVDRSGSFSYNEVDLDALDLACQEAKKQFKKLTGQEAKVFLSLDSF